MSRFIDADLAAKKIIALAKEPDYQHEDEDWRAGLYMAADVLDEVPTAAEVEEAKWISADSSRYGSMYADAKCSNCGGGVDGYVSIHYKFCPFCGKRMEEYKPYEAVTAVGKDVVMLGASISGNETGGITIYGYKVEETQHDD